MKTGRAVIFANGELPDPAAAKTLLQPGDTLIAVDGGLHHMQSLGLIPAVLIVLFQWVFPWAEPLLPFGQTTVGS